MARLILVVLGFFGLSAFGETPQEKKMLDNLIHKFQTDREYYWGLYKSLNF